ncbi:molecular chaperone DnaK, partial [Roseateles sp. GG27B]
AAIKDVETAIKGEDKADIEAKTEILMTASQKLGEKIYADAQGAQAAAGAAGGPGAEQPQAAQAAGKPADDNVVDAEFKEVKDSK